MKQVWSNRNRDHDRSGDNKAAMRETLVPAPAECCPGYGTSHFAIWTDGEQASNPNVKVKVKFTLQQAMKAHWGDRGIALLFL